MVARDRVVVVPVGRGRRARMLVPSTFVSGLTGGRMRRLVAKEHRRSRHPLQGQRGHEEPSDHQTKKRH